MPNPGHFLTLRNTCYGRVARGSFKFGWKEHNFSFNFQYWWLLENSIKLFPWTSSLTVLDIFTLCLSGVSMMMMWSCHDDVRWPTDGGVTGNQDRGQGSRGHSPEQTQRRHTGTILSRGGWVIVPLIIFMFFRVNEFIITTLLVEYSMFSSLFLFYTFFRGQQISKTYYKEVSYLVVVQRLKLLISLKVLFLVNLIFLSVKLE